MAQTAKHLSTMWETWVRSLGQEDPLEKEMAFQYSCLENSMDGGAWWATVHGVAKSLTRLSDFTSLTQSLQWASLVDQMVKNLPAMQKTQALSLDQKDFLEKGMAIHSSILAWRIPFTEEHGRLQFKELGMIE